MIKDRSGHYIQVGRYKNSPIVLVLSDTANRTAALKPLTIYRLWSDVACNFRFGDSAVDATLNDHPIGASGEVQHVTDDADLFLSAIVANGTGTLFISELDVDMM